MCSSRRSHAEQLAVRPGGAGDQRGDGRAVRVVDLGASGDAGPAHHRNLSALWGDAGVEDGHVDAGTALGQRLRLPDPQQRERRARIGRVDDGVGDVAAQY
jgi:hypothetical protein